MKITLKLYSIVIIWGNLVYGVDCKLYILPQLDNRQQQELIGCIENESKVKLENYDIYPPGFKDKKINNWLWRPM